VSEILGLLRVHLFQTHQNPGIFPAEIAVSNRPVSETPGLLIAPASCGANFDTGLTRGFRIWVDVEQPISDTGLLDTQDPQGFGAFGIGGRAAIEL
jgi:hypothetical protein